MGGLSMKPARRTKRSLRSFQTRRQDTSECTADDDRKEAPVPREKTDPEESASFRADEQAAQGLPVGGPREAGSADD